MNIEVLFEHILAMLYFEKDSISVGFEMVLSKQLTKKPTMESNKATIHTKTENDRNVTNQ